MSVDGVQEHVKIRGFCNHESFGGVGMAIPDRVNLFRAQGLRSVGGQFTQPALVITSGHIQSD